MDAAGDLTGSVEAGNDLAGDVEQKTTVKGSTGASDEVKGEFTGNFVYGATLGIQAESAKGFAIGLKAGYAGGQKDVNFKLEVRKQF